MYVQNLGQHLPAHCVSYCGEGGKLVALTVKKGSWANTIVQMQL